LPRLELIENSDELIEKLRFWIRYKISLVILHIFNTSISPYLLFAVFKAFVQGEKR